MAYKPKSKVQDEILDVIKNKTTVKKGAIHIDGHKLPDPKAHQRISFIKSGIRIAGYGLLFYSIPIAASVLVFSEVIGIYEELV
jgi:hypothetical protein|tara:strand:+ start:4529 stop:4780 length:252 start_codon:yes stop_codon:yes gene_type:complete